MLSPASLASWAVAFAVAYYTTPSSKPAVVPLTQQEIEQMNAKKKRETGTQY
jgi:hypothetical protein